ncbi:DUF262 domain-containing protein [Shewanella oncorhynchi]|uniref:DUF262 domain-containing protein n=1 Tax=Shewanella oncorhynchi TaxID=2726434 RepID=UPI002E7B8B6F|nr:DUF262 domain-containing protein [Shewanella oncorhynchi]WVI91960.1 DUF262 domain-containing protein [Shewanella oncorhynchi]
MNGLRQKLDDIQKKAIERTVKTQTIEYDLETMVKKIERNIIKLNPDYQRRHRWSEQTSSRLIESLILNIPVPFIYISQDIDVDEEVDDEVARYSVIDGQQRLTAIYNFFKSKFELEGLEVLTDLNGSKYNTLPPFLIRRLEERTIRCLRIDSTLDGQVKYDIFERLNSGSVKLEPQELRNATCRGPFKDLVKKLAKNQHFASLCQLDPDGKRVQKMEDEELIVRFFALTHKDGYKDYKGAFKSFLTEKMIAFNKLEKTELLEMEDVFLKSFKFINNSGDEFPFSKYKASVVELTGEIILERMSKFNAAVYDSLIVSSKYAMEKQDSLDIKNFRELFKDTEFFSSVEGSVNDVSKLNIRIQKAILVLC